MHCKGGDLLKILESPWGSKKRKHIACFATMFSNFMENNQNFESFCGKELVCIGSPAAKSSRNKHSEQMCQ